MSAETSVRIRHKPTVAEQLRKGVHRLADNWMGGDVGKVDSEFRNQLGLSERAIANRRDADRIPGQLSGIEFWTWVWLILSKGKEDLSWLTTLIRSTWLTEGYDPTPEWLRAHLCQARWNNIAPAEQEIGKLVSELFDKRSKEGVPPFPPYGHPSAPFIGPIPFRTSDADIFFGRERCLNELMTKIEDQGWPLLIVNGQSGAGKTSLLRAGLTPRLQKSGYDVVYASILDSPRSDVLRAFREALPATAGATDILEAVRMIGPQSGLPHCLVLIVDQVERCFTVAQDSKDWMGFWQDMGRLMRGEAPCSTKVVFAVRADWLHAFQRVSPDTLDVPVFDFLYLLDPLTVAEAREALVNPFERFGVALDPTLVDSVLGDLASADGYVGPPQLQIVGAALYGLLKNSRRVEARLSIDDYSQSLRGARFIIRQHLANTVNSLGPNAGLGWSILLNLVGPRNQRLERREQDLRGNLSVQEFDRIVGHLINARLVMRELSAATGAPVFLLTHDYLIEEIIDHFKTDPQLSKLQTARNYLSSALTDWHEAKRTSGQEVLLDGERYYSIYSERRRIGGLAADAYEFLALSALQNGDLGFGEWMAELPADRVEPVLTRAVEFCLAEEESRRHAAQAALLKAIQKGALGSEHQKYLQELFWKEFTTPAPTPASKGNQLAMVAPTPRAERRHDTVRMLWALRSKADRSGLLKLVPAAGHTWLHDHRTEFITGTAASVLIASALLAFFLVRRWQKGTWQEISTLKAGPISAVALETGAEDAIYAVTIRGPASKDSSTIFRRTPAEGWQLISRSFANGWVPVLVVARSGDSSRIYAAVQGTGILRSDDRGSHWETINTGLRSYDIRSMVVDPEDPDTLYVSSGDKKGVFETRDGGRHWQDISGDEMFGASVFTMAYQPADGGTILAGTDAGMIAAYDRGNAKWKVVSRIGGVGAITWLAVDPSKGGYAYAGTSTGNVLASTDGVEQWRKLNPPPGVFHIVSIAVVPGDPQLLLMDAFGIGGNIVWRSDDAGQSWQPVADDRFTREPLMLLAGHERVYAAGPAGFFETSDGGWSWEYASDIGAPTATVLDIALSPIAAGPTYALVGGSIYSTLEPDSGGWARAGGLPAVEVRDVEPDPTLADVAFAGVYLPNKWSVYYTADRGVSWHQTIAPEGIPESFLNDTRTIVLSAADNEAVMYAGTTGCGVFRSDDRGMTWRTWGRVDCSLSGDAPKDLIDLAIDPYDPDTVYAAADKNRVYVSRDGGERWQAGSIALTAPIVAIATDPVVRERLYLTAGPDGFWRSDDGARTWTHTGKELESKSVRHLVVVPGVAETIMLATTAAEVWKSTNGGLAWKLVNEELAVSGISALAATDSRGGLLLGNDLGGMYRYRPGSWPNLQR
jgi:photosystem II stability/assembly factor-like uncharacterized protein